MKNLKKVLALVTVVAVLLTCVPAVFASSYSDVSDNASYAEAVEMLSKLGIFTGYEDGTFQPDKTITRAEAAAVITRFLNQEATAKAMGGDTKFNDMGGAEWATGYVNFGVQKEYINGMGDGTFHPSDPVTYEQIVKMIVAALGYEIKAQDQGGYPAGYLSVASQLEITKGTSGSNGAASRATVAKLLYQALDVYKMVVSSYKSNGEKEYSSDPEYSDTPLHQDHKVDKYVGVVTDSYLVNYDSNHKDKDVTISYTEKNNVTYPRAEQETALVGDTNAATLLGYTVTAYVKVDDDTDKDVIIAIAAKGTKNSVLTVPAANLYRGTVKEPEDPYKVTANGQVVSYWKNKDADKRQTEIDLSNNVTVINNNKDGNAENINAAENGILTFISNDGNTSEYEFVIISSYDNEFVIDEIDTENYRVEAMSGSNTGAEDQYVLDPEDDDKMFTIIKDGKAASFEDLEEGDTVSVIGEDNDAQITFYVSSAKVEGKVSKATTGADAKYTIDGSQYELVKKSNAKVSVGREGIFYINVDGMIVYADTSEDAEGNYGYLIAADERESFGRSTWSLEFVDENGNDVTAKLATKVRIGEGKVDLSTSVKAEDIATDSTSKVVWAKLFEVVDGKEKAKPQLFKYDTNSAGEINKLIVAKNTKVKEEFSVAGPKVEKEGEKSETYTAKTNRAGKYEFDDDTVIFNAKEVVKDATDVSVSTVSALFTDGEKTPAFQAYDMKDDSKVVGAVVVYGAADAVDESQNVIVVTSVSSAKFDDDTGYVIEGLQAGKSVTFNVCDEIEELSDKSYNPAYLEKGDVIMVTEGVDYLVNIVRKTGLRELQLDNEGKPVLDENDKPIYEVGLKAMDKTDTSKKRESRDVIWKVKERSTNDITLDNGTEINVAGAKFTLVSTTGAKVNVKASSVGAINPTNTKHYSYVVYARYYDDDAIDVVIYEIKDDEVNQYYKVPTDE